MYLHILRYRDLHAHSKSEGGGLFSGKKRKALLSLTLHCHDSTPSFHGPSMEKPLESHSHSQTLGLGPPLAAEPGVMTPLIRIVKKHHLEDITKPRK